MSKNGRQSTIPVVDLFAGPGGLGEGFSAFRDHASDTHPFDVRLSIEKEPNAHQTLLLRTFFRQFPDGQAPDAYYSYVRGEITKEKLFSTNSSAFAAAKKIAWRATLGKIRRNTLKSRMDEAKGHASAWVLIGGPPCQAYSVIGRSKMGEANESDRRHVLYRSYLRVIADHRPPVFVMENVRGLLSAKRYGKGIFEKMRQDLKHPAKALRQGDGPQYTLHSLDIEHARPGADGREFLVRSERFGVPQARHRVIIVGVREDVDVRPKPLTRVSEVATVREVLTGMPEIRSKLSRTPDDVVKWKAATAQFFSASLFRQIENRALVEDIGSALAGMRNDVSIGGRFELARNTEPLMLHEWLDDPRLKGVCNHEARGHMDSDLARYLFAACFAKNANRSPTLGDFPPDLLPDHLNVHQSAAKRPFNDRFRVQMADRPATTVTAHIAKDGHYYIHHDPMQCRSWTVREAARVQTFPDNYFFEGPRTSQYQQVGNAVPPYLAYQIAEAVLDVLDRWE